MVLSISVDMLSKKHYDLVSDDGLDCRIPLYNEEAFRHGLQFQAKYIGTLDVPRPSSRVEIVAAMRRIRFEFRAKAVKKKKVKMTVSIDGLSIQLQKKPKKMAVTWMEDPLLLMSHPVHRIFYVSHDSQDLKIFSFIARDGATNVFRCNVFKAYKKTEALRIVRTIGQVFDVCHKLTQQVTAPNDAGSDAGSERSLNERDKPDNTGVNKELKKVEVTMSSLSGDMTDTGMSGQQAVCVTSVNSQMDEVSLTGVSVTVHHQIQLLRQQLQQQCDETRAAVAQVELLKEQLRAETGARVEAQSQTHELLERNRCLLQHITSLVTKLEQMGSTGAAPVDSSCTDLDKEVCPLPVMITPECGATPHLYLHAGPPCGLSDEMTESPDSGHKEMSSDSLSCTHGEWLLPCPLRMCDTCSCGHPNTVDGVQTAGNDDGVMQNSTKRGRCTFDSSSTMPVLSGDSTKHKTTHCNSETQTDDRFDNFPRGTEGDVPLLIPPPNVNPSNPLCLSSKITGQRHHRNCGVNPVINTDIASPPRTTGLVITKPPSRNLFLQVQSFYKDICKRKSSRELNHPWKNTEAVSSRTSQHHETLQQCKDAIKAKNCHRKSPQNADVGKTFHSSEMKHSLQMSAVLAPENGVIAGAEGALEEPGRGAKSRSEDTAPLLPTTLDSMTLDDFVALP